jgi:hypothetical protein
MHHCPFLRPCYYNGSPEAAAEVFNEFKVRGEPAIWDALRDTYDERLLAKR